MRHLLFILTSSFALLAFGQTENFVFTGVIKTLDNQSYDYKLSIAITNASVKGFSLTDEGGADETKAKIEGKYEYQTGTLTISETEIIYSKAENISDFCLLSTKSKILTKNRKTSLIGAIWGTVKQDTCFKGVLALTASSYSKENVKPEKPVASDPIEPKPAIPTLAEKPPLEVKKITHGESIKITTKSDFISIWIWDTKNEDGDQVSLKVNGVSYLYKYVVVKEKKHIQLDLKKLGSNEVTIEIIAESEGSIAPNTMNFSVDTDQQSYRFESFLRETEKAFVVIERVKIEAR